MRLALYEPDIPQNTGAVMRLAACLGVPLDIVEPCGFLLDDRRLKRVVMDYGEALTMRRHDSWRAFEDWRRAPDGGGRLLLLTGRGETIYTDFDFRAGDIVMLGRESAGVPEAVHRAAAARLRIPMAAGTRSLNVAMAAAMVLGEALRQTRRN